MSQERVMLLIDADNLSVDVMEQAVRLLLNQHGGLHVRRAYCTAESAVANQAAFKRLGIKPMVNLAAGKNSTDIAMAVDAVDLVLAERPEVVVIASSDSDFAPLVQRLREKGCVVRGIGQKGKVGDETQDVYDDYTVIEHRGGSAGRAPSRGAAKPGAAPRTSRARSAKAAAVAVPAAAATAPRNAAAQADHQPVAATAEKPASSRRTASGRSRATPTPQAVEVAVPQGGDTRDIFDAIVEGALDADLAAEDTKPAVKTGSRARKTAAGGKTRAAKQAAERGSADADAVVTDTVVAADAVDDRATDATPAAAPVPEAAATPTAPAKARGRKPKATATTPADAAPASVGEPPAPVAAAPTAAPTSAPTSAPAPTAAPAPAASARRPAPPPASDEPAGAAAPRATLSAVMACLPELARGQALALNVAVQRLREARLLGKNTSSLKLFSQLSDSFELLPARNPSQVRMRR